MSVYHTIFTVGAAVPKQQEVHGDDNIDKVESIHRWSIKPETHDPDFPSNEICNVLKPWNSSFINLISAGGCSTSTRYQVMELESSTTILSNERIPKEAIDAIKIYCDDWFKTDMFLFTCVEIKLDDLSIVWRTDPLEHEHCVSNCGCTPLVVRTTPITDFPIPPLSNGIYTGVYSDSWNDALSSEKAREWILRQGVDLSKNKNAITISSKKQTILTKGVTITENMGDHTVGFPRLQL